MKFQNFILTLSTLWHIRRVVSIRWRIFLPFRQRFPLRETALFPSLRLGKMALRTAAKLLLCQRQFFVDRALLSAYASFSNKSKTATLADSTPKLPAASLNAGIILPEIILSQLLEFRSEFSYLMPQQSCLKSFF